MLFIIPVTPCYPFGIRKGLPYHLLFIKDLENTAAVFNQKQNAVPGAKIFWDKKYLYA